jgi:hypothetical protein
VLIVERKMRTAKLQREFEKGNAGEDNLGGDQGAKSFAFEIVSPIIAKTQFKLLDEVL